MDLTVTHTFHLIGKQEKKELGFIETENKEVNNQPQTNQTNLPPGLPSSFYSLAPHLQEEVLRRLQNINATRNTQPLNNQQIPNQQDPHQVRRFQIVMQFNVTDIIKQLGRIALLALIFTSNQGFRKWLSLFLLFLSISIVYKLFFDRGVEQEQPRQPEVVPPVNQPDQEATVPDPVPVQTEAPRSILGTCGRIIWLFFATLNPAYQ